MRRVPFIYALVSLALIPAAAQATTVVKGTIPVSAQIRPGYTLSAAVIKDAPVSQLSHSDQQDGAGPLPLWRPQIVVSFEAQPSMHLVQRTSWDELRHRLSIDF